MKSYGGGGREYAGRRTLSFMGHCSAVTTVSCRGIGMEGFLRVPPIDRGYEYSHLT